MALRKLYARLPLVLRRPVRVMRDRMRLQTARLWRRTLRKPVFIGITGSAGKTTTKELLLAILSPGLRGSGTPNTWNDLDAVARSVLRARAGDDYCVIEVSAHRPDYMQKPLALVRPHIGIVTVVGNDHWSAYHSRDAVAKEKVKLVASLPRDGTAVLNADDELVAAMAQHCAGKVITYGISPGAEVRAENVRSVWPERLTFSVVRGAERAEVRTQLCGSHWVSSVLGAVAGGLAMGLTLRDCAEGIARTAPLTARMQPVTTPGGVTFIRDDWKASLWTVDPCFEFMSAARAKRKIIVIGTLSDYSGTPSVKYKQVARRAQQIADVTVFVGRYAAYALRARVPGREEALRVFTHVRDAAAFVNSNSREGDLVLLKGTTVQEHLLRVILARTGDIACWRDDCRLDVFCDQCPHRMKPSGAELAPLADTATSAAEPTSDERPTPDSDRRIIVGLGNPGAEYDRTPHNLGRDVLDRIAGSLGLTWEPHADELIARGRWKDREVCLVKLQTPMNMSGAGLKRLAGRLSFGPENCILVHDDLDLPIGSVHTRMRGSAGGHRGVASILEAFQTDLFRRVKLGVKPPGEKVDAARYVLAAFPPADRRTVDQAVAIAEARALELASR